MTDKEETNTYNGDSDSDDGTQFKPIKFNTLPKYVQILLVGLLLGGGIFGIYLVGMGINNMIIPPMVVSEGNITGDYPLSYQDLYYKSDKHNELIITNHDTIHADRVWIGTSEEYQAFRDGKLLDGVTHNFEGINGIISPNSIKFKTTLKYYGEYENILDKINSHKKYIVILNNDKTTLRNYSLKLEGDNIDTKFSISQIP